MAIKGLTDSGKLRRDGKIRAGRKKELGGGRSVPENLDHFLLHDAPGLSTVLGDTPKEIFFTVGSDNPAVAAQSDLRWYVKSELVCMGDGEKAAYMANGDHPGVSSVPVPGMRARQRTCGYKACSDFVAGNCSEHILLDMVIPQYSMSSIYTLENTSIIAVLNIDSALKKVCRGRMGKIAGEIFCLYKDKQNVKFLNTKDGKNSSRETDVVNIRHVPFEIYEKEFRSKIKDEDWKVLMFWRGMAPGKIDGLLQIAESVTTQLDGPTQQQLASPPARSLPDPQAQEEALKVRANAPEAAPWFEKAAKVSGKPNTEEWRIATAKHFPTTGVMIEGMKKRIKELEKAASESVPAEATTPPPQAQATVQQTPAAADNLLG